MPRSRIYLSTMVGFLLLGSVLFSFLVSRAVHPKQVEEKLVEAIESMTEGELTFTGFDIFYFPRPGAKLKGAKLILQDKKAPSLTSEEIKITLQVLPLLFGKIQIAGVRLHQGRVELSGIQDPFVSKHASLEKLEMKVGALEAGRPIRVEFSSSFAGFEKAISGKMTFAYDPSLTWRSMPSMLMGDLQLKGLALQELKLPEFLKSEFQVSRGMLTGKVHFERPNKESDLEVKTDFHVAQFSYQIYDGAKWISSPEMAGDLSGHVGFNPKTSEISLRKFNFELPMGKWDASGRMFAETGELRDVRISLLGIGLDKIPQYYLPIQQAIPVNIGFSGQSDLEMALSGTLDHLSIHGQWDLTQALLSYGGVFSKPKDVQMNASFDLLVKKMKSYSGDFTLKMRDAKIKGTLADFEWPSGKGQLNFITNKFSLAGWQEMIPPFRDYQLDGQVKILANLSGNYKTVQSLKPMVNITLDKVSMIHRQNGTGIREMSMSVDYGIVALKVKDAVMAVQNSPLQFSMTIYNVESEPNAKGKVFSENFDVALWLATLEDFYMDRLGDDQLAMMQRIESFLKNLGVTREPLKSFQADLAYAKNQLTIPNLNFNFFDGDVKAQANVNFSESPVKHSLHLEANRIGLAKFFATLKESKGILDGNLFLKLDLAGAGFEEGVWTKTLEGKGVFSITNGEFQTFDVLKELGKSSELQKISGAVTGKTAFNDLRCEFVIADDKLKTDDLKLVSSAFQIDAKGDTTLEGILNYRAEVFLSKELTSKVLGGMAQNFVTLEGKQLGPIPVLVAGPLGKPEVKMDPALFPQFKERLLKKGAGEALRNFLPEEAFFEHKAKS